MSETTREGTNPDVIEETSLEEEIGKPRAEWTAEDLVVLAGKVDVGIVSLMHVGGDGRLKTVDFAPRDLGHLRGILEGGERADGSRLFPGTKTPESASDVGLRPRPSSAFMDPFSTVPTLAMMCGHAGPDGAPLPHSPDTVVRRAHRRLEEETGLDLRARGDVEFFLGKPWEETDAPGAEERGYHASSPFVFGDGVRREAMAVLASIGVPVRHGHSEVGYVEASETDGVVWEQHEVALSLMPLPEAAEAILLARWTVGNVARREGMRCSTEPIVLTGHAGNALHCGFAPVKDRRPVALRDDRGGPSEPSRWIVGGLLRMSGALMAFGNRTKGSFTRLSQAGETRGNAAWADLDRSAPVRIPLVAAVRGETIEFRLPDGSALPHLLLAGAAQAVLLGRATEDLDALLERTRAGAAPADETTRVPRSFKEVAEAVAARRGDLEAGGVFPPALVDRVLDRLEA